MFKTGAFRELCAISAGIEGFLTDREGWLLYQLARRASGGCIVEIGSWQGKSTVWIGLGAQAGASQGETPRVYAIDPHTGSEEHQKPGEKIWTFERFKANISRNGLDRTVTPVVERAHNARRTFEQPVSLLFIDGAHDYDSVKQDYELWAPLVVEGGYIVFHDTQQAGVKKFVDEIIPTGPFTKVYFQDTICYGKKVARPSPVDAFRSRGMIRLKNEFLDVCDGAVSKEQKKWVKQRVKFARALLTIL